MSKSHGIREVFATTFAKLETHSDLDRFKIFRKRPCLQILRTTADSEIFFNNTANLRYLSYYERLNCFRH